MANLILINMLNATLITLTIILFSVNIVVLNKYFKLKKELKRIAFLNRVLKSRFSEYVETNRKNTK